MERILSHVFITKTIATRQVYNGPRVVKFILAKSKKKIGQKWFLNKKDKKNA